LRNLWIDASDHHNQINQLRLDAVLAKNLSNQSLDTIPLYSPGKNSLARDYSKSGVCLAIAHKEDLVEFIGNIFCMNNMVESISAQYSMCSSES